MIGAAWSDRIPKLPKAIARHEVLCTFEDVARADGAGCLKPRGAVSIWCIGPFRLAELIVTLAKV